jgi:uncharacterized protein (DUF488 family)
MAVIYTLGHSNRSLAEFLQLLSLVSAEIVVDVRRWPTSRKYPWFSEEVLRPVLEDNGIGYVWMGEALGGYRRVGKDIDRKVEIPKCYKSQGFNVYAAYILNSPQARIALYQIEKLAQSSVTVILCSERLPWKCHRKIISEVLSIRGHKVIHIIDEEKMLAHKPSTCMIEYYKKYIK